MMPEGYVETGNDLSNGAPRCSARACRAAAATDLQWRNPALHDGSRLKHWLACPEHVEELASFLDRRGFLLGRSPVA